MIRLKAPLAFLVACAVLVSGCTANEPEPAATEPDPCIVEAADDFRCIDPDLPPDERPHLHDYWGGQDRLEFERVSTLLHGIHCASLNRLAVLHPADGDAVIQGTASVEVTLAWTEPQPYEARGPIELWVKTAADAEPWQVAEVENGQRIVIETSNDQNDLPHQRLSAWEFHVMVHPADPVGCAAYPTPLPPDMGFGEEYHARVTLDVELVRGHEIPLHPGHPDRWDELDRLPLLEQEASVFIHQSGSLVEGCFVGPTGNDCLEPPHRPEDGHIVPFDAQFVEVTVEHLGDSPLRIGLAYHDAQTRKLTTLTPTDDDGTTRTYRIEVGSGGDGPYALQSLWEFWPFPEGPSDTYSGSYRIQAEAVRSLDGSSRGGGGVASDEQEA